MKRLLLSILLRTGMVGLGANNATARLDNVAVQVLPPEITLEEEEDFSDGVADRFVPVSGNWTVSASEYVGTPSTGPAISLIDLGQPLDGSSVLEIGTQVETDSSAGIVFDYYGPSDFKFVALNSSTDEVVIGHAEHA